MHKTLMSLVAIAIGFGWLGTAQAEQPIALKFWTFLPVQGSDPRSTALKGVIDGFNKSQSKYEVSVESINYARIDNTVIQSTAAGQGPDILNVYTDQLSMHAAAKTIVPLDSYLAAMSPAEVEDFLISPNALRIGGHVMALPWEMRVWLLGYRKDLLDNAHQKVPATLDEVANAAAVVSTDQVMGFGMGASTAGLGAQAMETFAPIFWGAGGQMFDDKGNTTINSEAGVKTLSWLGDLVKRNAMKSTVVSMGAEDIQTAFRAGTVGMQIVGSYRVGATRNSPTTGDNFQTTPIPGWTADKPMPARLASQTLTIGTTSKHKDGAWEFIKYYLGTPSQIEFAKAGVLPSKASSYQDPFFGESSQGKEIRGWADYARQRGRMEMTPRDFSRLSEELAKAIQKVILEGMDPKAALDAAATAYNGQRH
ncbi:sugar ABC transporter substrate-binding protein [Telmatospirillum sp.]|uniref:ABC transporter substrate-binding protein n=1 Tax=Telmatospirillum sp. TaxID=2079197 RepID=UPI0028427392|nr:sugar ABC transporter substrate-binding protein [Telmatospirillum sp.]MDR3436986.1 sugar ABC transporter substrate-binding protein [Telmatospirillum sp.]